MCRKNQLKLADCKEEDDDFLLTLLPTGPSFILFLFFFSSYCLWGFCVGHEPSGTELGCVAKKMPPSPQPEICWAPLVCSHEKKKERKDFCFITFWTIRCIILYKKDYNTWTFEPTELKNCFHDIEWGSILEHCIRLHLSTVGQHMLLLLVVWCLHFPPFHDANSVWASKTSSSRHTNKRLWFSGDGGHILCPDKLLPFF